MSGAFTRILNPGTVRGWMFKSEGDIPVFVAVKFDGRRLSITGVEGPRRNGDAWGGCGQIGVAAVTPGEGWTAETVGRLQTVWDAWHLNDMRAGCEHQRAEGWGREVIEVVSYKLTHEAMRLRDAARKRATAAGLTGAPLELDATERALAELADWFKDRYTPPDADSPLSGCYEVAKRETKTAGWVREDEHPWGVLSKPCPACGYKYGGAWLFEAVPADVLEWLESLPESVAVPAWV